MVFPLRKKPRPEQAPECSEQDVVATIAADAFEENTLEFARYFFVSFAHPESQAWVDAFWEAEQNFPPPFGATIAHALLIAVNEMRGQRQRPFEFRNPNCPNCSRDLTNEERYLMSTLRAIREGNRSQATTHALLLCESDDTAGFLGALERVAMITGDIAEPAYN